MTETTGLDEQAKDAHAEPIASEERSITPAPEDFENPPPFSALLWPIGWLVGLLALYGIVEACGWTPWSSH